MNKKIYKLVLLALLSAIIIVLEMFSSVFTIGQFNLTLVLLPVVIGAATAGSFAGLGLGLVFGASVLLLGQATAFLTFNPAATIFIVLLKGGLAGFAAGFAYNMLKEKNSMLAVIIAGAVAPIVNTGIFIAGAYLFFLPQIKELAAGSDVTAFIFISLVGFNFIIELGINLVLNPIIVRLIQYGEKKRFIA